MIGLSLPTGGSTPEKTVRAALIRFLAIGGDVSAPVHENGIQLIGAYICDDLDLFGCDIRHRLKLNKCYIAKRVTLRDARTRTINLEGSRVDSIHGSGVKLSGSLTLSGGFLAEGQVRLAGARIIGNLDCTGGKFVEREIEGEVGKFALYCSRARIGGSVYLREAFDAHGEVRFENAVIDGNLDCTEGKFCGDPWALNCVQTKIHGAAILNRQPLKSENKPFSAQGKVSFRGATIGGNLESIGGEINNRNNVALFFSQAKINGSVFLSEKFSALGAVRFRNADIGGSLDFSKAKFSNPRLSEEDLPLPIPNDTTVFDGRRIQLSRGKAITFSATKISGDEALSIPLSIKEKSIFLALLSAGSLNFSGAVINSDVHEEDKAINGVNATILGDVLFLPTKDKADTRPFTSTGEVSLNGAEIHGDLLCTGGRFSGHETDVPSNKRTLSFSTSKIAGGVFLNKDFNNGFTGFLSNGVVEFHDAEIGRNLNCSGGLFNNPEGRAVDGTGAKIGSNVYFSLSFKANGTVRMNSTEIGGQFICCGGEFSNVRKPEASLDPTEDPRCENALKLRNAIIRNDLCLGRTAHNSKIVKEPDDKLWGPAKIDGSLDLRDARVGVLADNSENWKGWKERNKNSNCESKKLCRYVLLDGFVYGRLAACRTGVSCRALSIS